MESLAVAHMCNHPDSVRGTHARAGSGETGDWIYIDLSCVDSLASNEAQT